MMRVFAMATISKKHTQTDFDRIGLALAFIEASFKDQPSLEDIAKHVKMSPHHFQRMFTKWAGTSPKKFLQYISLEHAKKLLAQDKLSVQTATMKTGLSGSSRLHDLFVKIEGMTPGEFKNGGENLSINYSFAQTPFGKVIAAATQKGVCYIAFGEDEKESFSLLKEKFPKSTFRKQKDSFQKRALALFTQNGKSVREIRLHLKGTDFQLKVWEALLKIPAGGLSTYGNIAARIKKPNAFRAVGTAVGDNPVSFLIPCHRVIQSSGVLGNYHWGPMRKTAMIGWEAARKDVANGRKLGSLRTPPDPL
jgi:AraC family transcriptional regulator of adaptative response/methylated-DNA-[protein]-cysteine methyltransferase